MSGSWAVVTGAAGGIGSVIARSAIGAGYRVAAWDIDAEGLAYLATELGDALTTAVVDVGDQAAVEEAAAALPEAPRLVVNNAGVVRFGPLLDLTVADWTTVLGTNLTGTFVVARTLVRRMIPAGGGTVVNIASVNGVTAAVDAGAYTSSKAGVARLTEQMALEWADRGVRVNAVAPGLIDAGMSNAVNSDPDVRERRSAAVPVGRQGAAQDVADVVLFLASDRAAYVTGQTVTVDGGLVRAALSGIPRSAPDRCG
ncbi:SDR family NAD(P)-dependent oxidoreductase [Pseudonocardia endophytica]|uniref:NADP-dependent 3-hydroxy acid dehydrogenase YdfG n=1 Tax=Pseudonocardia endophytica TaxID=401976 RepID=A0A4R1HXX5_PSEEN|nr:SDR family NAD(P)-dependent oxidoreductase [Pseudonocardia endophytica]TCK26383.1 NADP-dependent 3-hydroxy acid dehydrogenase YdfG [Pseudonocardia endophytica]